MPEIIEILDDDQKEFICRDILSDLPEWFGIPEANEAYFQGVREKRFWIARTKGKTASFAAITYHNDFTVEIYLIASYMLYRNRGIGSALLKYIINMLRTTGKQYLTVKTLAGSHPSKEYAETRKFYLANGFVPLEIFPELWGKEIPCLMLVKSL